MKKTAAILSVATIGAMIASGVTAFADQTIDGRDGITSGDVLVNGIIGEFDNTTEGPDPENMDEWINVTIPTTALFYTTRDSGHTEITSPTYKITNNSYAGVIASVAGVADDNGMGEVTSLSIGNITLFSDGTAETFETVQELFTLSGNTGDNASSDFQFSGTAALADTSIEQNPQFNLVLSFSTNK